MVAPLSTDAALLEATEGAALAYAGHRGPPTRPLSAAGSDFVRCAEGLSNLVRDRLGN